MKVFVYKKDSTSERQMVINDVIKVEEKPRKAQLVVTSATVGAVVLDTKYVKTSIFQN